MNPDLCLGPKMAMLTIKLHSIDLPSKLFFKYFKSWINYFESDNENINYDEIFKKSSKNNVM